MHPYPFSSYADEFDMPVCIIDTNSVSCVVIPEFHVSITLVGLPDASWNPFLIAAVQNPGFWL